MAKLDAEVAGGALLSFGEIDFLNYFHSMFLYFASKARARL